MYHASSNWSTGEKIIVMEDLSEKGVVSGFYFGDGTPLNWGKDLAQLTRSVLFHGTSETCIRINVLCKTYFEFGQRHGSVNKVSCSMDP